MTLPPKHSPQFGNPVNHNPPPGTDANNSITSNLQQSQPVAVTGANTKDASLVNYDKPPVAVLDADKVKNMQNETPDGASGARVAGA